MAQIPSPTKADGTPLRKVADESDLDPEDHGALDIKLDPQLWRSPAPNGAAERGRQR